MTGYSIGEVAERTGFTASALRYYEGIGLVAPSGRTGGGYRIYDDRALARLAFIARAKELGCTLDEITDLAEVWDAERCGPVQRRLHELVTEKLAAAERRIGDLTAFTTQLRAAGAQLSQPATDGPCNDDCACTAASRPAEPPVACTLDPSAVPDRLAAWSEVLHHEVSRTVMHDGATRLELDPAAVDLGALVPLIQAEQACCRFLAFSITIDGRGFALEVRAPAEAAEVLTALLKST